MKFKKLGALILGALLSIGVAAGVGATVEKDVAYAASSEYELVTNYEVGQQVLIVSSRTNSDTHYYLPTSGGSSSAPSATSVTISNNKISADLDAHLFEIESATNGYKFKKVNSSNYLYCTSANNGIRIGTNPNNVFTITKTSTGYCLKNIATSRYVGLYNTQDWRCYTSATQSNYGGSAEAIKFFVKSTGGSTTQTQTITITSGANPVEVDSNIILETNAESATWSLSNENATLSSETDKEVTLTGVTEGTVDVTATANGYKDATITITITAKQSGGNGDDSEDTGAKPGTYTFNITPSNFNNSSYDANNNEKTTIAKNENGDEYEVKWTSYQVMLQSSDMQWQKSKGYIYNSTDLIDIDSIEITKSAGTFTTNINTVKQPSSNGENGGYFKISVGGATGKTTKIKITFTIPSSSVEKTITSIDSVATQPEAIYQGSQINVNDFTFNVTYNDGTKGVVNADSIDLSTENDGEVTATAHFGNITFNFVVTVEKNDIDSFSWSSRDLSNKIAFEGTKISEVVNINDWKFTVTYKNGSTETYTGINDTVKVAFYDSDKPTVENTDYITEDYKLTLEHNGKFLVACYKGEKFSGSNAESKVTVIESLNSINYTSLEAKKTLTFDNVSKRTEFSTTKQVWSENGITFTNNKSNSKNDIVDYSNPVRLYANSSITIEASGMNEIEFDCNTAAYATELKSSIGDSATASSDKVTVSFDEAVDTFTVESLTAQVRLDAITVKGSGETVVELANKNITAQASIVDFAKRFNAALADVCALSAEDKPAEFDTSWSVAKTAYDETIGALTGDDKTFAENMIKYATATWINADVLQQALKTYEVVVGYGMEAFLGEVRSVSSSNPFAINALVNDSTTLVLIVVGMAAILGFAFFYYTKRKERKIEF